MEILFVSHKYPPSIGGMQKQSFELIEGMRSRTLVHTIIFTGQESKVTFFLKLKSRIKSMLKKNPSIGAIHLNDGSLAAFCTWLPSMADIPIFVTLHGLDVVYPSRLYQRYIFPKFNRYTKLVCVSKSTRDECMKRGIDADKLSVINNGVDSISADFDPDIEFKKQFFKKYAIQPNEKIIVSIGRPVKRKGFSWFIREVLSRLDNTRYIIIGPYDDNDKSIQKLLNYLPGLIKNRINLLFGCSDDGAELEYLKNSLAFKNKVICTGKLSYNNKLQVLRSANLFVMPNIQVDGDIEGFGLVALEASEMGIPVLASGIEGIVDAIQHNKNGYLASSQNRQDWIHNVNKILNNRDQTKHISTRFQAYTRAHYSWEKMINAYADLIFSYSSDVQKNGFVPDQFLLIA